MAAWARLAQPGVLITDVNTIFTIPMGEMHDVRVSIIARPVMHDLGRAFLYVNNPMLGDNHPKQTTLKVDTSLAGPVRRGYMYQIMGDITDYPDRNERILKAFGVNDVTSIDHTFYDIARQRRQRYRDDR